MVDVLTNKEIAEPLKTKTTDGSNQDFDNARMSNLPISKVAAAVGAAIQPEILGFPSLTIVHNDDRVTESPMPNAESNKKVRPPSAAQIALRLDPGITSVGQLDLPVDPRMPFRDNTQPAEMAVRPLDQNVHPLDQTALPNGGFSIENKDKTSSVHQPDGSIITVANGQVTSVVSPEGQVRTFKYDDKGAITEIGETDHSVWVKGNDGKWYQTMNGKRTGATNDAAVSVDAYGNYTLTHKDGSKETRNTDESTVTVDSTGRRTTVRYKDGSQREFERGADGRINSYTETDGAKWVREADGKFHEQRNGKDTGRSSDFEPEVDGHGNYTLKKPDGSYEVRKSDGSRVDHDNKGRVSRVEYPNGAGARSFAYDDKGNLQRVVEADGTDWEVNSDGSFSHYDKDHKFMSVAHLSIDGEGDLKIAKSQDGTYDLYSTNNTHLVFDPPTDKTLWGVNGDGDPLKSIVPANVKQGGLGDCYFESALAALANTNPQAVKNMIKDNGDGTYTVTFPGDRNHPVTVTKPTTRELETYGQPGDDGSMWAALIEKAHRQYTGRETSDPGSAMNDGLNLLSADGSTVYSFSRFDEFELGKIGPISIPRPSFGASSRSDVENALINATQNHQAVVAATATEPAQWLHLQNSSGDYVGAHVYTVTGYDPKTNTVTIRNPWGTDSHDNGNGGYFQMSLDDFMKYFTDMAVQNR